MREHKLLFAALALIFALLAVVVAFGAPPKTKLQKQPSPERITEIQKALVAHGYQSGRDWFETKEVCRKVADEHGWQNMWAPDTRVLILLGVSPNDPTIAAKSGNRLDQQSRAWVADNGVGKLK